MKKRTVAYVVFAAMSGPILIWACPFTFRNTGSKALIIADMYANAQVVQPGEKITVKAPMKNEVAFELPIEDKNAHARFNVYEETTPGNFSNIFRLQEVECGKGSVVESGNLPKMAETERSGRFTVADLSKNPLVIIKGDS